MHLVPDHEKDAAWLPVTSGPLGFGDPYAAMPGRDRMFKRTYSANDLLVPLTIQLTVSVNVLFKME